MPVKLREVYEGDGDGVRTGGFRRFRRTTSGLEEFMQNVQEGLEQGEEVRASVEMTSHGGEKVQVAVTNALGVSGADVENVLESSAFVDWLRSIEEDPKMFINPERGIHVQSVDMFGPRVGFVKFKAAAQHDIGGTEGLIDVPGIVFMRGGAVGVLVVLRCEGKEYTVLTCQARVPVGDSNLPEIPAGMLDGSGDFKGVAAAELEQECEIQINAEQLVDLTGLAFGEQWRGLMPSAGGCDEFIRLYLYQQEVTAEQLQTFEG
eukprot:COSAG01_NODE_3086_length_6611_cov_12.899109_2_plen_262_part_00